VIRSRGASSPIDKRNRPDFLEMLLTEIDGQILRSPSPGNHSPAGAGVDPDTRWLPILAPEIVLPHKSGNLDADTWFEFRAIPPALDARRRA
jgi:hypothetical protein